MLHFASNLDPSIQLAFTSQAEGNLALHVNDDPRLVAENRARLEDLIGVRRFSLNFMNQVHSADVHEVQPVQRTSWLEPAAPTCDGLLDATGAQPLAVMVADCLPVLFVGRNSQSGQTLSAATHAGRRGLLDGILENTVEALRAHGADVMEAVIGPSICGRCYEVPEDMAQESEQLRPGIRTATRWGTPGLDLPASAEDELRGLGVDVRQSGVCTLEDENYYSYRRSSRSGRLAGLIWTAA
ncbi:MULTISPECIES: polyphenol oxidase family protein [Glutamicibacter]|uniref:polyphenol oxidase family protein n=1 Tax=Glutamicibacter TaxID=1742989 RepID=UPI000EF91498|nr:MULTISPECIES: polyphenol oxidase family protein [Glutamicibacter]MDV2976401.1 polyphenol oxidase family protein [Actinomycetes bacterium ARC8]QEP07597.1 laccase domain-containing protein [Glutamicibacter sp. ZJUTW]RWZ84055.1 laccase domain-containing protein [Glutamicibacter sp. HZAU]UTM46864.1 polyphenol oxidase family protein [Glutamicibacter mysorens]